MSQTLHPTALIPSLLVIHVSLWWFLLVIGHLICLPFSAAVHPCLLHTNRFHSVLPTRWEIRGDKSSKTRQSSPLTVVQQDHSSTCFSPLTNCFLIYSPPPTPSSLHREMHSCVIFSSVVCSTEVYCLFRFTARWTNRLWLTHICEYVCLLSKSEL